MTSVIWPILDALAAPTSPAQEPVQALGAMDIIFNASGLVQFVLLLLTTFSFWTWAIIFSKWKLVGKLQRGTESFLEVFWSGRSMDHIYSEAKKHSSVPVAKIFQAGYKELQRLMDKERQKTGKETPKETTKDSKDPLQTAPPESSIQNLERAVTTAERNALQDLEQSMTFLATAASTAPFIGLFGTVWGIMNSFQNIGAQGGASLAVVAPGIAEALIATAVGLGCAIPATMGYNFFVQKIRWQHTQMENFSGDFLNIVKRNFLSH